MQHKISLRMAVLTLALTVAAVVPATARALGLGEIQSDTRIGQPFTARIPITGASAGSLQGLHVELASREDYQNANIGEPDYLFSLKFSVEQGSNGPYIKVSSPDPVRLPFLNLLIHARWASGEVTRQYTVLLNPPVFVSGSQSGVQAGASGGAPAQPQPSPQQQPSATPSRPAAKASQQQPAQSVQQQPEQPAQEQSQTEQPSGATPATQPAPSAGSEAPSDYQVNRGDTLWGIAHRARPQNVSVNQMMIAVYRANPHAFRGNINRLKAGYVLHMPSRSEIAQVTAEEATRIVARQNSEWQGAGSASRVAASSAGQSAGGTASPAGSTSQSGAAGNQAAIAPSTGGHVVLTAPEVTSAATVAAAPGSAVAGTAAAAAMAGAGAGRATAEGTAAGAGASEAAGTGASAGGPMKVRSNAMAGMAATAANKAVAKPKPARKPPAANNVNSVNSVSSSEEEGSGIGYWLQQPTGWIVIGAVVLILLALLLLLLQRRRSAAGGDKATPAAPAKSGRGEEGHGDGHDAGPEASAPIEEGIPHEAEAGIENATAEGRAGHHDEDLGIATYIGGPSLDVNKVDALDEADLHLGFGDYTKAAASLREAIAREPSRVELRRKLLEVLFAAGDGESFAAEAEAYRPHADAADWEAVAVMGRQLRPNDDLFAAAETASAGARVSTEQPSTEGAGTETLGGDFLDIDLDKLSVDRGDNPDQSEFERTMDELSTFIETYVPASTDTPVSLQLPPEEREPAPAGQAVDEPGTAAPVQEAEDEPLAAPEDEPLEFSLDEGDLPSPTEGEPKAPAEIDWDEDAGGDGENLVDTKLDLARAYIDMGDSDSARSVLEEVIDEGDETQSGEARRLMESLD